MTFIMSERFEADYLIETPCDPSHATAVMAGEQSSGTFVKVHGETTELQARAAAQVTKITILETTDTPTLTGGLKGANYHRAKVTLSWPLDNIGPDLPNLMATVAGNLFELSQFSGLRILDIRLPRSFANEYPGPKFGITGTRALANVNTGPIIGTIIKPSVGLTAESTADLVKSLAEAGIDFIKDDELQANGPACPFEERVRLVMNVINAHADRTGKKVMYAFNLTGEVDHMRKRHDFALAHGATCVMASLNSVGISGFLGLSRHSALPIHAHRNGWGYLSRAHMLGWSYQAWSKIWRLAGADHMHVNGLQNKFSESNESVISSAKSLLTPLFEDAPYVAMPVFSSGQTVLQPPETFQQMGNSDCIYAAGGGIMGHPDGPRAGVAALRQSWQAAMSGVSPDDYATSHVELARALEAYRP